MSKINQSSPVTNHPKIGAHVSAAISLEFAFDKAQKIGAECLQFFVSPPQQWAFTNHDSEEIQRFKSKALETQIGPNFIHGTYLVNLGTEKEEHLRKSIDWLIYGMRMAEKLGIQGVIFHTGSHKGKGLDGAMDQIVGAIKEVMSKSLGDAGQPLPSPLLQGGGIKTEVSKLSSRAERSDLINNGQPEALGNKIATSQTPRNDNNQTPKKPYLILETSAGAGGSIGKNFAELGQILKRVQDYRVKVCIDTAHTFAAGYDWRSNIEAILEEFDREVGLSSLAAIHANDSKMDFESYKDRHANIGEGFMGQIAFAQLLNHPKLAEVPFLLEVPGFADDGPDKDNVDLLKKLRD